MDYQKKVSNFIVDYFNFSYFKEGSEDLLQDFLDDFPEIEAHTHEMVVLKGRSWGYDHCLAFNEYISIRYDDTFKDKGVNVSITGHGLEDFLNWFHFYDITLDSAPEISPTVALVFSLLRDRGCRPSRLDLAYDDYSKRFMPDDYQRWLMNGNFNTRMKKNGFFRDPKGGTTFYLGNRRKKLIRIYDKSIESDSNIDAIRYEFELHGDYAKAMFDQICEEDVPRFGDIIVDSFKIINPDSDSNITRCEMLVEWEDFLKSTLTQNYVEVRHYTRSQTWDKLDKWLHCQVFPALKAYEMMYGKSWLLLELRKQELPDKYITLLKEYLE